MRNYSVASFVTMAAALAILPLVPMPVAGQVKAADPRMKDGKPDFSGVYMAGWFKTGRAFDSSKMSPFKPGGEAFFQQRLTGDVLHDDPTALCMPDGFPREILSGYAQQWIQEPGYVVIRYEYMHFSRFIPTDGRPHPKNVDLTFMGDSVAKWEGDTLVIDTIGLKQWVLDAFHEDGVRFHSDALHVIERLHRTDPKTIAYEITIDDPKIFTKPWSDSITMVLHPDWQIFEQVCEENNRCEAGHCKKE